MSNCSTYVEYISIHAAREGGDNVDVIGCSGLCISIHAAREGGDVQRWKRKDFRDISIHAAREGGDVCAQNCRLRKVDYFNPRRP